MMKKEKSITRIFAFYIICFCITSILLIVGSFIVFQLGINTGIIQPANYYEQQIERERNNIEKSHEPGSFIPAACNYAVYDAEGNILAKNTSETKAIEMWDIVQNNKTSKGHYYYKTVQREYGVCIIEYRINAALADPVWQKYIPDFELCFDLLVMILFIMEVVIFSKSFKRRLYKELKILKDVTENIQMENLDFKVKYSDICEINEVITALDKMKNELNNSLKNQWQMEERRKEQMSALAHDIKTPLTIIKGNAELLGELELDAEQKQFNEGILSEIASIESYIKSLIEIIKTEKESELQIENINLNDFIDDIVEQGIAQSMTKKLDFKSEIKDIPEFISADKNALKRAIGNVISNAVEYCPLNGEILFSVCCDDNNLKFVIEDSGRGFSREELNNATEQFFQGDKSRNSKNHYGMGLYIVKNIIKKHNGSMILENSRVLAGAKVILEIPLQK